MIMMMHSVLLINISTIFLHSRHLKRHHIIENLQCNKLDQGQLSQKTSLLQFDKYSIMLSISSIVEADRKYLNISSKP
ncbi:hypothetical protein KFK09_007757 [Dendrobium nobile]|uniref:Uncharacterized protein n=1 Tax=Dendrobium nobile TaxID=94219 RepID=A0A8T3BSQ9_DENNO|nr:hypothetical protein KFK09_007757 [Dendrobium nobile]